jgi:hypothetical protein
MKPALQEMPANKTAAKPEVVLPLFFRWIADNGLPFPVGRPADGRPAEKRSAFRHGLCRSIPLRSAGYAVAEGAALFRPTISIREEAICKVAICEAAICEAAICEVGICEVGICGAAIRRTPIDHPP